MTVAILGIALFFSFRYVFYAQATFGERRLFVFASLPLILLTLAVIEVASTRLARRSVVVGGALALVVTLAAALASGRRRRSSGQERDTLVAVHGRGGDDTVRFAVARRRREDTRFVSVVDRPNQPYGGPRAVPSTRHRERGPERPSGHDAVPPRSRSVFERPQRARRRLRDRSPPRGARRGAGSLVRSRNRRPRGLQRPRERCEPEPPKTAPNRPATTVSTRFLTEVVGELPFTRAVRNGLRRPEPSAGGPEAPDAGGPRPLAAGLVVPPWLDRPSSPPPPSSPLSMPSGESSPAR